MSLPMFEINYDNEKTVLTDSTDKTILEISLEHGIPHMHICGGNARCSTCRVLVMDNPENLSNPGENEIKLAELKGFEKNIRLACQSRVKGNVTIRRLLHDENDVKIAVAESSGGSGKEKNIAVLFSDIRNFTSFSEKELPYDIIHILSRYFNAMGDAVINHHGYIDKYIGDGLMALFGLEDESETDTCFNAVSAALDMKKRLKNFNQYLKKNYETEFNIGIGIHFGPAVVGEMGHIKKHQLTAIGDSVNLASRIESATKKTQSELLVSENVFN
ncbi:MAG: adenylate/guanylate cyclase domain-containing protein, partial [Spirochaetia bacterium]|nr:adenylate/guanylate cyclase domain-containing protein [Spirochaetia bacterium]